MAVEFDSSFLGRDGCRDDSSPTFREKEKERLGLAAAAVEEGLRGSLT